MTKVPLLQSGFASLTSSGLSRPLPADDLMIKRLLFKDFLISNLDQFYSVEVNDLYDSWCKFPAKIREFEFREQILLSAMKAFNVDSIYKWIDAQNKLAQMSNYHDKFLEDTFNFILGRPRCIELPQWVKLIEFEHHPRAIALNYDNFFHGGCLPSGLPELFNLWLSRPNGFEDLLQTAYVIYGNRPWITNVREKNT